MPNNTTGAGQALIASDWFARSRIMMGSWNQKGTRLRVPWVHRLRLSPPRHKLPGFGRIAASSQEKLHHQHVTTNSCCQVYIKSLIYGDFLAFVQRDAIAAPKQLAVAVVALAV